MQYTERFKKNNSEPGLRDGAYAVAASVAIHIGMALILMTATALSTGLSRWEDPVAHVSLVSMSPSQAIPADSRTGYDRQRKAVNNTARPAAAVSIDKAEQIMQEQLLPDVRAARPSGAARSVAAGVVESEAKGQTNSASNPAGFQDQGRPDPLPITPVSIAAPRYRDNAHPAYPGVARLRGYEGVVLLFAEISADGQVETLKIKKSSGFSILDRSAIEAVKVWKFEPGRRSGMAVPMWVDVPVKFILTDNRAAI
jgi:protein TonB